MRVLVSGGAGFIGSHTVDLLLAEGHEVRVLDSLDSQVHGSDPRRPGYLHPDAELHVGDVRDRDAVRRALAGVDAVMHLAAAVGVGQSMYEIERYVSVNSIGAAVLLEELVERRRDLRRVVVASSMSIYGEGSYCDAEGVAVDAVPRPDEQLAARRFELCDAAGRPLRPLPTPESKRLAPTSVYAVTKRDHEELFLAVGRAYDIPTVALRYFNTYGPRQALSNPYTGVVAIFSAQLLNDKPPPIYEDGLQSRDFIHVADIARANVLALEREQAVGQVFNVGTGRATSVREVAETLTRLLGTRVEAEVSGRFRAGDIRHCYADGTAIERELGFRAETPLDEGLTGLLDWLRGQRPDDGAEARAELERRGLSR